MTKDAKYPAEFEDGQLKKESIDYAAALRILDAMWEEAQRMGILPLEDPLEGIEDPE